jgi:hypothetical protein
MCVVWLQPSRRLVFYELQLHQQLEIHWGKMVETCGGYVWRTLNSLKDSNVSPSERQRKKEELGRTP